MSSYDFGTSDPTPEASSFGAGQPSGGVPVVIVDDDQAVRSRLAMQLGESAVTVGSIDELRPRLNGTPVVVVLGPSVSTTAGLADAEGEVDRLARLCEAGLTDAELSRLSSPIGLDLGARTPEETAVSIAAEIIARRWGGGGQPLRDLRGRIHHEQSG